MGNHPNRKAKAKYPISLVRTWLESQQETPGNTKAAVIEKLNSDLGTNYNQGRLYQWLNLEREPERETRAYMIRTCLPYVLYRHGVKPDSLTAAQLRVIAEALS